MSFNWGGFGLGFSDGFDKGTRTAKTINDLVKEDRLAKIREQGLAEAKAKELNDNPSEPDGKPTATSDSAAAPTPAPTSAPAAAPAPTPAPAAPTTPDATPAPEPAPKSPPPVDASLEGKPGTTPAPVEPTPAPSAAPNVAPTAAPTAAPSITPTVAPSAAPAAPQAKASPVTTVASAGLPVKKGSGMTAHDYFLRDTAPAIRDEYLAQGDMAKAQEWETYIQSSKGKSAINAWAKGMTKIMAGDWNGGVDAFGDYYTHHVDDGVSYAGKELVMGPNGQVQGANIKLKDKNGNITTMQVDAATIQKMGAAYNPQTLFEMNRQDQVARQKVEAEVGLKKMEIGAQDRRTVYTQEQENKRNAASVQGRKEVAKMTADRQTENITLKSYLDRQDVGAKQKAELESKRDALKAAGYSDDFINQNMPALLGIDQYKRQASPEEARRMILQERVKDPIFSRKSPEEQKKIIDGDMGLIYGGMSAGQASVANPVAPNPAASGLPKPSAAPSQVPAAAPQYVRDKQTGAIYAVNPDGSKTLIKGAPGK